MLNLRFYIRGVGGNRTLVQILQYNNTLYSLWDRPIKIWLPPFHFFYRAMEKQLTINLKHKDFRPKGTMLPLPIQLH